jgi:hypothetical protein
MYKMSKIYYKAIIYKDVYKDSYENGEIGIINFDMPTVIEKENLSDLISEILNFLDVKLEDLYIDNCNSYGFSTEIWCEKQTNENHVIPTEKEIDDWKNGNIILYSESYHILVSMIHETEATKEEIESTKIKRINI